MTLSELIDLCRCPCCEEKLQLGQEAQVDCSMGHSFPIVFDRVLVLMRDQELNAQQSSKVINAETSKSFSEQWNLYKPGDKIWGMTKDQLKALTLQETKWKESDFRGKRILDLGCGHGVHTQLFAEMGADVVGFDISEGFFATAENVPDSFEEQVYFVQGDVFHFPFQKDSFDLIWSEGVLHHTPDTRRAFDQAYPAVKPSGRFYVALYNSNGPNNKYVKMLRKITTRLPESILLFLCWVMAPIFGLLKSVLNMLNAGARHFEYRSIRENAVSLHDTFSPPYAWHHSVEEVKGWFDSSGFDNIHLSENVPHLFGMFGDKKKVEAPTMVSAEEKN